MRAFLSIFRFSSIRFTITLLFLAVCIRSVNAQTDTIHVNLIQPDSILGCHENIFFVFMQVDTATSLNIQFQVRDSSGVAADTSCVGITPFIVTLLQGSSLVSGDVFNPYTGIWSCNLSPGSVSFSLSVALDCSVIQINSSGNVTLSSTLIHQLWTASGNDYFNINTSGQNQINSPNIFNPYLLDVAPNVIPTVYGDTTDIIFEYKNNGITANVKFWFDPNGSGNNCTSFQQTDSLKYGVRDTNGVVSFSTLIPLTWQNVLLPRFHSIVIKRTIAPTGCLLDCNSENSTFKWRCDVSAQADTLFCDDCQQTFYHAYSLVTTDSLKPKLLLERILPNENVAKFDYSCPGESVNWQFRIKNISSRATVPLSNFALAYNGDSLRNLTHIPSLSITLDTSGCHGCSVDTSLLLRSVPEYCSIPQPLSRLQFAIRELHAGDSVDISFTTIRCCSEVDSVFLNHPKFFNKWYLIGNGIDSCSQLVVQNLAHSPNQPYLGDPNQGSISAHSVNNLSDLNLQLEFVPTVSDLTVPNGSTFGPTVDLNVTFQGMFSSGDDYQILGCDLSASCMLKGYLRARIFTDPGLHIRDFSSVYFQHDSLADWHPMF
jgi:hypothetical protein